MIEEAIKDADRRMQKSIEVLHSDFTKIRTGRANASLLDHVMVEYYGSEVPIGQVANVNSEDARTLSITPWEKEMVPVVEKAILKSDLGLTPNTAGTIIRINLPPLTEERRRELVKVVRGEAENARVAIRNIRRDINQDVKEMLSEKMISEDEAHGAEQKIQKLTDKHIAEVDSALAAKEEEMMEI